MSTRLGLSALLFSCIFVSVGISQSEGKLFLKENKLIGECDNKYYTGFEIELDAVYHSVDSTQLFKQLPRLGYIDFKKKGKVPTEFRSTDRAGYSQVIFRFRNDWITFDELVFESDHITFTIDIDPEVPPTASDLRIVRLAKDILGEEKYWHQTDDRICDDDIANKSYSIYCAVKLATLTIENDYNHRNATLQKLRHLISAKHPYKKWTHRLMDFNNMPETQYADIIGILSDIETSFERVLMRRGIETTPTKN